mmetsp:Transcript_20658/g.26657  ORF Transcript_20658/g.26657 Transcript_20658/m.26657 type:complete len:111 (+) Transcript_20658:22-354(+)
MMLAFSIELHSLLTVKPNSAFNSVSPKHEDKTIIGMGGSCPINHKLHTLCYKFDSSGDFGAQSKMWCNRLLVFLGWMVYSLIHPFVSQKELCVFSCLQRNLRCYEWHDQN